MMWSNKKSIGIEIQKKVLVGVSLEKNESSDGPTFKITRKKDIPFESPQELTTALREISVDLDFNSKKKYITR